MFTVALSDMRRNPQLLLSQSGQQAPVKRGEEVESLSVVLTTRTGDREAVNRWLSRSADRKANPRNGGSAAVRRLRDGR